MVMYLQNWRTNLQMFHKNTLSGFNNFIWISLVVTLFQIRKRLPNMQQFDLVECYQVTRQPIIKMHFPDCDEVFDYLFDFFVFYGEIYSPKAHIISPHYGKLQFRAIFEASKRKLQPTVDDER